MGNDVARRPVRLVNSPSGLLLGAGYAVCTHLLRIFQAFCGLSDCFTLICLPKGKPNVSLWSISWGSMFLLRLD
jgi:hypothetical protein